MSRSRYWATGRVAESRSASASARCRGAIRKSSRRRRAPPSTPRCEKRCRAPLSRSCARAGTGAPARSSSSSTRRARFYFLEVNTRLQVEHPVTEEVYGIDLVAAQLDVALGEWPKIPTAAPERWAIEARVLAEDPRSGFLPTPGRVLRYREPFGPGLRVDSGVGEGSRILPGFDSLIAKVIASGETREEAIERLASGLEVMVVHGPRTNLPFLQAVLRHPDFRSGQDLDGLDRGSSRRAEPVAASSGARSKALDPGFSRESFPRAPRRARRRPRALPPSGSSRLETTTPGSEAVSRRARSVSSSIRPEASFRSRGEVSKARAPSRPPSVRRSWR